MASARLGSRCFDTSGPLDTLTRSLAWIRTAFHLISNSLFYVNLLHWCMGVPRERRKSGIAQPRGIEEPWLSVTDNVSRVSVVFVL